MRRLAFIGSVAIASVACRTIALDVGSNETAAADAGSTLVDRLRARCAADAGAADSFANAEELTQRLPGRWYYCAELSTWDTPPVGLEVQLASSGSWAFLRYDADAGAFDASSDPNESGNLLYLVPVGTQPGPSDEIVPIDDTSTRNGFSIELVRGDQPDLRFIPDFEKDPRRLLLREVGPTPALGVFVPID